MKARTLADARRVPELDGVRGLAILLVLVWHYFVLQIVIAPGSLAYYGGRVLVLSWSGVDLFFVLSGFLIAGGLLDHREASSYFRVFYVRRACRILPLYAVLLALFLGLSATRMSASPSFRWLFHDPLPLWSYATFTQNIFMGARGDYGPHWLGITWSLAVEEQFYLLVPLLIYFLPRRALLGVLILGVLAAPMLRLASPGFHASVNTPWRADSLLLGATLAIGMRWRPFVDAVERHRRALLAAFAVLLGGTVVMTRWFAAPGPFNLLWLAALYAVLILIAVTGAEPRVARALRLRPLVWLGQRSYGIYLLHQAVSGLLHGALRQSPPQLRDPAAAIVTVLALGVTLVLAAVSYRFLEGPILRIGHRFPDAARPGTDGPSLPRGRQWRTSN